MVYMERVCGLNGRICRREFECASTMTVMPQGGKMPTGICKEVKAWAVDKFPGRSMELREVGKAKVEIFGTDGSSLGTVVQGEGDFSS